LDVIFDLGNVILDWNTEGILDSLCIDNNERYLLRDELFAHQDWLDMDCGLRSEACVVNRVIERSGLGIDIIDKALQAAKESLVPIPESVQLLREAHTAGMSVYCLSNMSVETYQHVKEKDFFSLFKGTVISGKEKCMKPDNQIFELIIKRYELNPASTLFIDDSLPNVQAANDLGMVGYHFMRSKECYSQIRMLLN